MPNWCYNSVQFDGDEKQISRIQKVFDKMIQIQVRTQKASKFLLIEKNEDLQYCFDINFEKGDDHMSYTTRWSPDPKTFVIISKLFNVGFHYECDESGMGIYGAYKFCPHENILYQKFLTDDDISSCHVCDNEEHGDPCKKEDCMHTFVNYDTMDNALEDTLWEECEEHSNIEYKHHVDPRREIQIINGVYPPTNADT